MAYLDSGDDLVVYFEANRIERPWWRRKYEVLLHIGDDFLVMRRYWWRDTAEDKALQFNEHFEHELLPHGEDARQEAARSAIADYIKEFGPFTEEELEGARLEVAAADEEVERRRAS